MLYREIVPAHVRVWVIMGLHAFHPLSGLVTNRNTSIDTGDTCVLWERAYTNSLQE